MKTQEDLYLEYARAITMVREYNEKHGTKVEPWSCVKGVFNMHPAFSAKGRNYEFALTILDSKPVFVGDILYEKENKNIIVYQPLKVVGMRKLIDVEVFVVRGENVEILSNLDEIEKSFSWTPPQKKRTFELNGVELPCPVKDRPDGVDAMFLRIGCNVFRFESIADRQKVETILVSQLYAARDKE